MRLPEESALVCCCRRDEVAAPILGSRALACAGCAAPIWLSPFTEEGALALEIPMKLLCTECFRRELEKTPNVHSELHILPGQLEEVAEEMKRRADAN